MNYLLYIALALAICAAPATAEIEQCRFIQAKPEREACYDRQAVALEVKRKRETTSRADDSKTLESLQQMRRDDEAVYQSLHSICRGC